MASSSDDEGFTFFMIVMTTLMGIVLSAVITSSASRGQEITRLCGVLWDAEIYDRGCPIWWDAKFKVPTKE